MEPQPRDVYIGDRLRYFQAAAACLSVGPKLRRAGRFCIVAGVVAVVLLTSHVPATSPVLWAYLALLGFGIYLHLPDPQPWVLPAAGLAILAVLTESIYVEYELWRRLHTAPRQSGFGVIIEILLAVTLFGSYLSYKQNLAATDAGTLAELRKFAVALNKADLDQETGIVELIRRNERMRLCRLDRFVLLATRHRVAFGAYSKLDTVAILKPEALTLAALGSLKPGRPVKLRFSAPKMKNLVMKLKPQYLSRVSSLGIATTGLPAAEIESGDTA